MPNFFEGRNAKNSSGICPPQMVWHAFEKMKHPLGQAFCLSKHPTSFFFPIIPAVVYDGKEF